MLKKRILILGGSFFQIPLIKAAKELGLYVITCDYLPDNPGHKLSDEYHNVSTTDKEAVYQLAKKINIDGIATLSSDPAIPTVAYVSHRLGLPGPPEGAVEILSDKGLFRRQMEKVGIKTPFSIIVDASMCLDSLYKFTTDIVVKPVDSCGSKGITFSPKNDDDLLVAINNALSHSRSKKCILEEYISGDQLHGDGYLEDGKCVYYFFGDHYFYTKTNNFIPISTRWPCKFSNDILDDVIKQVELICHSVGYSNGPVNIEARVSFDNVYLIEVAPRNGGNYVPIIQQHLTGFNVVNRIIASAIKESVLVTSAPIYKKVGAHYILHSEFDGFFDKVLFAEEILNKIFYKNIFKKNGDPVFEYVGSNTTIGVVLLEFDSIQERDNYMGNIKNFINVIVVQK
jgi:biotin carboxylase